MLSVWLTQGISASAVGTKKEMSAILISIAPALQMILIRYIGMHLAILMWIRDRHIRGGYIGLSERGETVIERPIYKIR